jgi:hypothetical protein
MSSEKIASALKIKDGLSRKELVGRKTKKEAEILKSLTNWHNNSTKRKFFIGEMKASR